MKRISHNALQKLEQQSTLEFFCELETTPIKGNVSKVNPETDAYLEKHVEESLTRGNQWAWCTVWVRASFRGYHGAASLGCCSYRNESEARADVYEDLKYDALSDLAGKLFDSLTLFHLIEMGLL